MQHASPEEEFGRYYKANLRRVGSRAVLLIGNQADAEDITQEAFAALYRQWPEAQTWEEGRRNSYVGQALRNRAVDIIRGQARQRRVTDRVASHSGQVIQFEDGVLDRLVARSEEVQAILRGLSPMERLVIVLSEVEELTAAEIADLLGIFPSTIRTYRQRAREKLRN